MPSSIAAVKPKMTCGPQINSAASAMIMVSDVITVRASVSFSDRSSRGTMAILRYFFRFSRTRSYTTIVSFRE